MNQKRRSDSTARTNGIKGTDRRSRRRMILAALCAALLTTGCGRPGESGSGGAEGGENAVMEANAAGDPAGTDSSLESILPPPSSFLGEEDMALADAWPACDDRALAAVMRKAEAGEPVTVCCIGGSITQGTISAGTRDGEVPEKKAYAEIFFSWWEERFPEVPFTFVNAGIGGTDSYLGVHRLDQDVLYCEPDLVLVEYSVNDGTGNFNKTTYDNLIYNLLGDDCKPAVMLLFMAQTNGASAQGDQTLVGFHYKVPMVSYGNVISDMMETGRYSDKELSGDQVHPSALGHAVTGEILWNYLNGVYAVRKDLVLPETEVPSPLTRAIYGNARVLDSDDLVPEELGDFAEKQVCQQFPGGWSCDGEGGIRFTASFSRLGILYYATTDGKSGRFEVLVDGEHVQTVNADFSGGWGNAIMAAEVYAADEAASHTVEIRREEGSEGSVFHLLGLLTSG